MLTWQYADEPGSGLMLKVLLCVHFTDVVCLVAL
jgi:hypothetical protein